MNLKKIIYVLIGTFSIVIGAIGAIVPLLPSFPFLLLATCCFGKSSDKLDHRFKSSTLYKNNLESYVTGNGMYMKVKIKILIMITILLTFGFIMMNDIFIGRLVIIIVWLFHIYYFSLKVKTIKKG